MEARWSYLATSSRHLEHEVNGVKPKIVSIMRVRSWSETEAHESLFLVLATWQGLRYARPFQAHL